jgi:hypothetical protein
MPRRKKDTIKTIVSTIGSAIIVGPPSRDPKDPGFIIPWETPAYLPPEWWEDPYIADYVKKGWVKVEVASEMPRPAVEFPQDMIPTDREWLRTLLYGPYTEPYRTQLSDWRDGSIAKGVTRKQVLLDRIRPLCEVAIDMESKLRARQDLLDDLQAVVTFIEEEGWRRDVQPKLGRGA